MSGELLVFQHDFSIDTDERPEWVGVPPRQYLDDFLSLGRPVEEYTPRVYKCSSLDVRILDFIPSEGTRGLFSQRFVDTIRSYIRPCFTLLPATLNGAPFYFLRREDSLDCLDAAQSTVRYFDDEKRTKIMSIKRFSFNTETLHCPLVFGLPGYLGFVFWTKPIVDICVKARLNGIRFITIDRINKNGGHIPPVSESESTDDS